MPAANILMTTFLTIFRRFYQNCSKGQTNNSEHYRAQNTPSHSLIIFRRFPKVTEDFRGRPDDISNHTRFQVTSSLSKIQNQSAAKVFILIRHKRWYIYICLQFYSSIACFIWKPEHFEFQSFDKKLRSHLSKNIYLS